MSERSWFRGWMVPAAVPVVATVLCGVSLLASGPCWGLYRQYGIWHDGYCPVGDVRARGDLRAWGVLRGSDEGRAVVRVDVRWMASGEDSPRQATTHWGSSARLELLDEQGQAVDGFVATQTAREDGHVFTLDVPGELADGDYTLRAIIGIAGEELTVDAPLALYAPALAHVALDRPLYEPGQAVRMRSVLFRRTDQAPLAGRPGRWEIRDPSGTPVHVEKDRAGPWGIADSTFYLASDAPIGTWAAVWRSDDAVDTVSFEVQPFTLPRFTVEAEPSDRWYHPGDTVRLTGRARYTSGAPVQDAAVAVDLEVAEGRWPLPVPWESTLEARTDAQGRFEVEIGEVPDEPLLRRELSALSARVRVTDETGESQVGGARVVLSADDIRVEVLTELEGGLVGGFNNRVWLRVTTPDGVPLPNASLAVRNPLDDASPTREAATDADGVAMLQLDPGDPISVPQPPVPVRVRPPERGPVQLTRATEHPGGSLDLRSRRVLDALHEAVGRCGDFVEGRAAAEVALRLDAAGRVVEVRAHDGLVSECVGEVLGTARFPAGEPRVMETAWSVPDSLRPTLPVQMHTVDGAETPVTRAFTRASLQARRCLARGRGRQGAEVLRGTWSWARDGATPVLDVLPSPGAGLTRAEQACILGKLRTARWEGSHGEAMGSLRLRLRRPGESITPPRPATFTTGYPVGVTATSDGAELGSSMAVVGVGRVPELRIRVTPSLVAPGETVTVDFLRGPGFRGRLPGKPQLLRGTREIGQAELPEDGPRQVRFTLPDDVRGFVTVEARGARGVAFVTDPAPLALDLSTDQPAYAPGDEATLTVRTTAGDRPVAAAVGLMGVDESLGQLAPLLGPDDLGRVTVRAASDTPAFGAFDARALALGRIRGEHAATAAVMSLSTLPMDPSGDRYASGDGQSAVDDLEILTRRFWRTRAHLVDRVRAWEASAAEGELLTHPRMASLWRATLDARAQAGEPVQDAFGRPLTLANLPRPLLARLDPREVATDATRLPEDVTSWTAWVDAEVR